MASTCRTLPPTSQPARPATRSSPRPATFSRPSPRSALSKRPLTLASSSASPSRMRTPRRQHHWLDVIAARAGITCSAPRWCSTRLVSPGPSSWLAPSRRSWASLRVPQAVLANDTPLGALTTPHYLYSAAPSQPVITPEDTTIVIEAQGRRRWRGLRLQDPLRPGGQPGRSPGPQRAHAAALRARRAPSASPFAARSSSPLPEPRSAAKALPAQSVTGVYAGWPYPAPS